MNKTLPDLIASKVKLPALTMAALQGKLMMIRGESVFAESVRAGAVTDLKGTLKMIKEQAEDPKSRAGLVRIVGEDLVSKIEKL